MTKRAFSWDGYREEMERSPDFDLMDTFSFDHLGDDLVESIISTMWEAAREYVSDAESIEQYLEARKAATAPGCEGPLH